MEEKALPIVITGHIDHGKSTLIGRLLYDTGILKEDRYQEITASSSLLGKETEFAFVLDALEEEREKRYNHRYDTDLFSDTEEEICNHRCTWP